MLKIKDARATLPAQNIVRARQFYEQLLGLSPMEEQPDGGLLFQAGNTAFTVFPSTGKASGDHTQIGLEVEDIVKAVSELKSSGVKIEEYDFPDLKTENGIVEMGDGKGCWFKDSEGNLIAVLQRVSAAASSTTRGGAATGR
jgi:predicted enzyme related to lactoylglutathione lyase